MLKISAVKSEGPFIYLQVEGWTLPPPLQALNDIMRRKAPLTAELEQAELDLQKADAKIASLQANKAAAEKSRMPGVAKRLQAIRQQIAEAMTEHEAALLFRDDLRRIVEQQTEELREPKRQDLGKIAAENKRRFDESVQEVAAILEKPIQTMIAANNTWLTASCMASHV